MQKKSSNSSDNRIVENVNISPFSFIDLFHTHNFKLLINFSLFTLECKSWFDNEDRPEPISKPSAS